MAGNINGAIKAAAISGAQPSVFFRMGVAFKLGSLRMRGKSSPITGILTLTWRSVSVL